MNAPPSPLQSVDELNARAEWLHDPARSSADNRGPHLLVIDDFHPDPEAVRASALRMKFVPYAKPCGTGTEAANARSSTAFVVFQGERVEHPFIGERYNPHGLRERLSVILDETIDEQSWSTGGDYWNGAFHLFDEHWSAEQGMIHHHYKPGDVPSRGWSGLVYLTPDAPPETGTSFWRDKATGRCIGDFGTMFRKDLQNLDLVLLVENRFNRLVLFRENVLHRAESGFGRGRNARLTQTFFFQSGR